MFGTYPLSVIETVSSATSAAGGPGGVSVAPVTGVVAVAIGVSPPARVVAVVIGVSVPTGVVSVSIGVVAVVIGVSVSIGVSVIAGVSSVVPIGVSVSPGVTPGVTVSLPAGCTHPAIMMLAITMRARIPNILFMWGTMLLGVNKLYPLPENENSGRKRPVDGCCTSVPPLDIFRGPVRPEKPSAMTVARIAGIPIVSGSLAALPSYGGTGGGPGGVCGAECPECCSG